MKGENAILKKLASEGIHSRVISVDHLEELGHDLRELLDQGLIDKGLWRRYLSHLKYEVPRELPEARSIVISAVPQPAYTITFHWKGRRIPAIVPPTYADGQAVMDHVRARLTEAFGSGRYGFVRARLPLKTLATRSGLASYGRNNITYVEGLGSFHRLTANFTDYPFERDDWQEREALSKCRSCRACRKACPTGAISGERFLIRADRCLVYLNEMPGSRPFPKWVRPEWHNAIVGCMLCQRACPYDSEVIGWSVERGEFDERETAYLLSGKFSGKKAADMKRRLDELGLDLRQMPRNLSVLLAQS